MMQDAAPLAFIVLPVVMATALAWGVVVASRRLGENPATRRRVLIVTVAGAAAWMGATWLVAARGVFHQWNATPPPFMLLVVGIVALAVTIACTSYGRRLALGLPLWTLVAAQSFRLPLELAMHEMSARGVMPVQMSYEGLNYDIVTGTTAIIVAVLARAGWGGRALVTAWNLLGLGLLSNIVTVAILSTPRFAYFGNDRLNEWVADPPYVWLPAVLVLAALAGHLLVFRALGVQRSQPAAPVT
jgi:hypothetical protein